LKLLLLKPSSLGDVVQALPVLRLIRRHHPAAEVWWWINAELAALLQDDPDLAGVIRFERRGWGSPRRWLEFWRQLRWMRAQRFDWVIDLQALARSGAIAWLANGRRLVGLDDPREGARGYYDIAVRRAGFHTHAVDWYLSVLPVLGVPVSNDFTWLPARPAVAAALREKWAVNHDHWLAVLPGARWDNKRWPVERFAEVVRRVLIQNATLRCAILGGNADKSLGETIAKAVPDRCLDLTGATSLPEMVEWLRLSRVVLTNDTGPMHVAAALGKPLVALFGPTEPRRTGPYGQLENSMQHPLPCAPCLKSRCRWSKPAECLAAITPETVVARVQSLLANPVG
jgi:lipopolysaccharide heptosyltransferase II